MEGGIKHLLEFGPFRVDTEQRVLLRDGQPIALTSKAFDLLVALLERHGHVVLKDDLMKRLWPDTFVEESNLGQHVFQLRKALGERPQDRSYIVTVPGRGYRFVHQVRALPSEEIVVVASRQRSTVVVEGGEERNLEGAVTASGPRSLQRPGSPFPESYSLSRRTAAWLAMASAVVAGTVAWLLVRTPPAPKVLRSVQLTFNGHAEPSGPVLTDGARIFFGEKFGGTETLAQVSELGGEPSPIRTSVATPALLDIDRARARLLVRAETPNANEEDPLWAVPTGGGSARRVGDISASYAAWSPDGQRIAYANHTSLFVAKDDGSDARKLFAANGVVEYVRWSPDGSKLTFSVRSSVDGTMDLWEIQPDGRDLRRLWFGWRPPTSRYGEGECCVDWSPDGRYTLFRSHREGAQTLWLIPRRRDWLGKDRIGKPIQIYTSGDRLNGLRFDASGKKLLYIHYQERRELVRYDSQRNLFVPYMSGIPARFVSFSHDGQWVAYKDERDKCLWRAHPDGSQALQLTFPPLDAYHPSWSPDDKTIAFEGSGRLYLVPFEGGKPDALLPEGTSAGQPSWSPDGKFLAFTRWPEVDKSTIGILELAGRRMEMLPNTWRFEDAQWSPDGKYLAVGNKTDEKVMLYDLAQKRWSVLADGSAYGWGIRWSADSKYVYYQLAFIGEDQPIFRVRVRDRKVEQITSSHPVLRADVLSFTMTGLTPDGSPLASFLHTNSDVYALELDMPK